MGDSAHKKELPLLLPLSSRMVPCPTIWVRMLIRHLLCSSQCWLSAGTRRQTNWTDSCTPSLKERNVDVPIRVRGGDREDIVGLRGGSAEARGAMGRACVRPPPEHALSDCQALGPRRAQVPGWAGWRPLAAAGPSVALCKGPVTSARSPPHPASFGAAEPAGAILAGK